MATFVDRVVLHAAGGNGGNGCASIRREKFKPLAGPDGANGGGGGSVYLEVDPSVTTLLDYHHRPHRSAQSGGQGAGDNRQGKNGEDTVLKVPEGTVVKDTDGTVLADLVGAGARYRVAAGGVGGLGNAALASPKRKAPGFALLGEPGEETSVVLELKSLADVALVGFPSAGKSSLIAAMSAARPKIADYPFTTLVPNLGVVDSENTRYTIADVPGLIPGASEGRGLGHEFLRHIERCAVVVHVIDAASLELDREPVADLEALEHELAQYAQGIEPVEGTVALMERPRVIVLNKVDMPDGEAVAQLAMEGLQKFGWPIYEVSALARTGLRELSFKLAEIVTQARSEIEVQPARQILRPMPVGQAKGGFTVVKRGGSSGDFYQVRGEKPERWVKQTDFGNDEAVGYLADRLNSLGVEKALYRAGAVAGATVVIGPEKGGVIFDWEPTVTTGAELLGPRGQDSRLDDNTRATRAERKRDYHEMMDAKEAARQELWQERESGHWTDPGQE